MVYGVSVRCMVCACGMMLSECGHVLRHEGYANGSLFLNVYRSFLVASFTNGEGDS